VVAFIIRRLIMLPMVLLAATMLIFGLMQFLSPAVRVTLFIGQNINMARDADRLIQQYGLDRPVWEQWWTWITSVFQGNFGFSKSVNMPVLDALMSFLPATLELTMFTVLPMLLGGIWLGVLAAKHQDRLIDHLARVFSVIGWSLPNFIFGLFLLMFFYGYWGWVSDGRLSVTNTVSLGGDLTFIRHTGMWTLDGLLNGRWEIFWDALKHLILPAVTLAFLTMALIVRVTRSSMLNALREDYVTTARAKGLREKDVVNKHAKRNAMIPVATLAGLLIAGFLGGVIVTETVFNFRGLGYWFAQAATQLDFPGVLGFTVFNGALIVVANLVVDIMYAVIDPRIRLD